ncbi:uncharacterized protein LOC114934726 [Nylanderia fulva]|nr:uncharacterized protein LOC114934726 [Nylanderia fulva]
MERVWNYYYSVTKKMLSLSGQWPYQEKKEKLLRMAIVTIFEISVLIPQVGQFIHCGRKVQCHLISAPSYLVYTVIMVKLLTCQILNYKIKHLTDQLNNDWKILKCPEEYEIMKIYAAKARLFSLIYSTYYFIGCPMFAIMSLIPKILDVVWPLNESRPVLMPHGGHYFVSDDTEYFYYILFHVLIAIVIILTAFLAHDCVILTYIEHVCGVFAVAGYRFENLSYNDVKNNIINQKIVSAVHAHWRALQFAEYLENTFSVTLVIQIFIVIISMSVTLLQMTVKLDSTIEAIRNAAFVGGQLIHIFCFSLQGQKLIDHSIQMQDKIYACSWYKIPVKLQKLLLPVMRRSLQPNFLSASGIYIFSLKSFMTVVQSSVSYFTVLASFQ